MLSNAETYAQIAVLAMLGPEGYASTGTADEPGTYLLTVGGSADRPAVVEVPSGLPLGEVLDLCGAAPWEGVLVGGYHGMWLPTETAYSVPVSRAGLQAAGGSLGAGIVLPLGEGTCPMGEVARVAGYLAKESSGQCGPCKLGLPSIARALKALADGSGGVDALDTARRGAAAVKGRGACAHPDGVFRFVLSAIDVFTDDLTAHLFRGTCGRRVQNVLPHARRGGRRPPVRRLDPLPGTRALRPPRAGTRATGRPGLPGVPGHAGAGMARVRGAAGRADVPGPGAPDDRVGPGRAQGSREGRRQGDRPARPAEGHRRPEGQQPEAGRQQAFRPRPRPRHSDMDVDEEWIAELSDIGRQIRPITD